MAPMDDTWTLVGDMPAKMGQSGNPSSPCVTIGVACGLAGLAVGIFVAAAAVMWKCKRDKAELQERIRLLQPKEDCKAEMVRALEKLKNEMETQRDQLRGQLSEAEAKREEYKKVLQAVEKEITEREAAFEKPEVLLRQKEDLLQAQWKLGETKRSCERQLLNLEKLQELLEAEISGILRRSRDAYN